MVALEENEPPTRVLGHAPSRAIRSASRDEIIEFAGPAQLVLILRQFRASIGLRHATIAAPEGV